MSTINLSQYRLNTWKDIREYKRQGGESFNLYYKAMKELLKGLKYGDKFDILNHIPEKNLEKFIKTACVYMAEQAFDEVIFSEDYLICPLNDVS